MALVVSGQPLHQVVGPVAPTPPVGAVYFWVPSQGVPVVPQTQQPCTAFTAPALILPQMQQQPVQQVPMASMAAEAAVEPAQPVDQADGRLTDARASLSNAATRRRRRQRANQQARMLRAATAGEAEPNSCSGGAGSTGSSGFREDVALARHLSAALERGADDPASAAGALQLLQDEPTTAARLAFQPAGCRTVQSALEVADRDAAVRIARCLQGRIPDAMRSPHANYVVQMIIKVLQPEDVPFVLEEIEAAGPELAFHEYGCRIYIRLLALGSLSPRLLRIVDDVLSQVRELIRHQYGHYVVEAVLEHGLPEHRQRVIAELLQDLANYSRNRHSAHVIDKALQHVSAHDRQTIGDEFAALPADELAALAKTQYGGMVLRTMQRTCGRFTELKASGRRGPQRLAAPT